MPAFNGLLCKFIKLRCKTALIGTAMLLRKVLSLLGHRVISILGTVVDTSAFIGEGKSIVGGEKSIKDT